MLMFNTNIMVFHRIHKEHEKMGGGGGGRKLAPEKKNSFC